MGPTVPCVHSDVTLPGQRMRLTAGPSLDLRDDGTPLSLLFTLSGLCGVQLSPACATIVYSGPGAALLSPVAVDWGNPGDMPDYSDSSSYWVRER